MVCRRNCRCPQSSSSSSQSPSQSVSLRTCTACAGNAAPANLQATFTGFVNDFCSDCAVYNATFLLGSFARQQSPGVPDICRWNKLNIPISCPFFTLTSIKALILNRAGNYELQVIVNGAGGTFTAYPVENVAWVFIKNFGTSKPNCRTWDALPCPLVQDLDPNCDGSATTCIVTSI